MRSILSDFAGQRCRDDMEERLKWMLSSSEVSHVIISYHHFDHHAAVGPSETTTTE